MCTRITGCEPLCTEACVHNAGPPRRAGPPSREGPPGRAEALEAGASRAPFPPMRRPYPSSTL